MSANMVDLVKWPLALIVVALVFMVLFRRAINDLLARTRKISKEGIEAVPAQEPASNLSPSAADQLLKTFYNALLLRHERTIREDLDRRQLPPTDRERVLARFLAGAGLGLLFERAFNMIFGSQIRALQYLNPIPAPGVAVEALRHFYTEGAGQYPTIYANYAFEQWLGFLASFKFLIVNGDKAIIGEEGREFLKYVIQMGYALNKVG